MTIGQDADFRDVLARSIGLDRALEPDPEAFERIGECYPKLGMLWRGGGSQGGKGMLKRPSAPHRSFGALTSV